ncbi:MAG TPA: hypothetical protein VFH10_11510 [Nocardioides sp.]|uniref:hypothetical protein n=1 Tax=Nocardioides sp. TaxID=35761 RepID=UPI002D80183B|nr:hypothetical protein [Nocardioides sp.]HET6653260.1 hypothetical protein [Nocardioides sp.]
MTNRRVPSLGGACAVVAGLLWVVKSTSILVTGYQPPVIYELAMLLFGLAVVGLAAGERARAVRTLGWAAAACGCLALVGEALGDTWNVAIVVSTLATLTGLLVAGLSAPARSPGSVAWVAVLIGAGTLPALVVLAGPLALVDERLIEVPLVLVGSAWVYLGGTMLNAATAAPTAAAAAPQSRDG